ncbi:T9SS type A sorting domain-containing protein [Flavobacterium sp.]|uniref:T9SS type A sorting domain-containing protein n=1 Tax=Flavobacterium sp. TaxID=239 RepID=UPI0037C150DB
MGIQIGANAQAPSDAARANLRSIIESVNVTSGVAIRYDTKDNLSRSMDCAKIISNPNGGFIAVYHHYVNGIPKVFIATSTNFRTWTMVRELANNASQPDIAEASDGGYVMAWEQEPNNHLKFCYYSTLSNLFNGITEKTYDASRTFSSCAEGTPNIYSASSTFIDVGFHYYKNCDVDRQARGTLTNFNSWTCNTQNQLDNALLFYGLKGNIGDRDAIDFEGYKFALIEGQAIKGDFGSWKSYIYDYQTGNAEPLNIITAKGSTAFANPTISNLTINGKKSLVMTFFVPSEGAMSGEAGELIYYKNLGVLGTSSNEYITENDGISIFPNPVKTQLTIKSNQELIKQVKIYNMLGNLVFSSNESFSGNKTFDTSSLRSGSYLLQIFTSPQTKNSWKSFKLLVL